MITFERLNSSYYPQLLQWLATSHVKEFWYKNKTFTLDMIIEKYDDRIKQKKIDMYIIKYEDLAIGYIQSYNIEDLAPFSITKPIIGIDLYIGHSDYIHRGIGPKVLKKYINNVFNEYPKVNHIGIDPEVDNKAAYIAYSKVGFTLVNTCVNQDDLKEYNYMILERDKFFCNL